MMAESPNLEFNLCTDFVRATLEVFKTDVLEPM